MIVMEGGWQCSTGHRDKSDFGGGRRHRNGDRHLEIKIERERKRQLKRRRKRARACDRRRAREVETKYGYHTYHKCTSKRRYDTLERALCAASTSGAVYGQRYYVYHCKLCDGYHLTTHYHGDVRDEAIGDIRAVESCCAKD